MAQHHPRTIEQQHRAEKRAEERGEEEGKKEEQQKKMSAVGRTVLWFLILYVITLAGFLITLPVEKTLTATIPVEHTLTETVTTLTESVKDIDCEEPEYDLVKEDVRQDDARIVTIRNNQEKAWSFTVSALFIYTNRTTATVPPEREEKVEEIVVIPAKTTKEIVLKPTANAARYDSIFARITVLPERRNECDIDTTAQNQTRSSSTTQVRNEVHTIPYTTEEHLWSYLFRKLRN